MTGFDHRHAFSNSKTILTASLLVLGIAIGLTVAVQLRAANAALGSFVHETYFSIGGVNDTCPIGVGITYDGGNLWYSCYSTGTIHRADPLTGVVTYSYQTNPQMSIGSMAYDKGRSGLWVDGGNGTVMFAHLNATQEIDSFTAKFTHPEQGFTLVDGLAYDAVTDEVLVSFDGATHIDSYSASTGSHIGSFPWAGNACYNSGVGIGGTALYEGSDGCSHVWVVNYASVNATYSGTPLFDFPTNINPNDPNFRDESLTCDPNTFAATGQQVMWSKEAYSPMRALAFEIPAGSCGVAGQFSYTNQLVQDGNVIPPGGTAKNNDLLNDTGYTNNPAVVHITFIWTKPDGTKIEHTVKTTEHNGIFSASDTITPDQAGHWTVKKDFCGKTQTEDSIMLPFFVLPESPVGVAALMGSSLAAFGAFMVWKKNAKKKSNSNEEERDEWS